MHQRENHEDYLFEIVKKTLLFVGDNTTTKEQIADLVMQTLLDIPHKDGNILDYREKLQTDMEYEQGCLQINGCDMWSAKEQEAYIKGLQRALQLTNPNN